MTCTRPCYHNPTLPRNLHNHTVNAHYTTGVVPTNPAVAARIRDHKYHVYVMLRYIHAYNSHAILLQFRTSMFIFEKHS
ncbi:hypothetical protein HanXRQr2_Chr04g0189171 [Helianthus annuus]|uniref:Uncharacterized protein n=1 Tax=Helianthus annuus TaxID=4232 RepID=A0A9K3JBX8_HELAN|nr:hypothetical protein HanXRQr2_Chr04g0189171 [Helianthus annuus]KAJ0591033.1 hypothetical protein HanIR_Chr04g0203941 [Helianthus annuus]KAJ0933255.1 hypothetical protein HanPSC8_Chr04g0182771 [Helianthus annuus]